MGIKDMLRKGKSGYRCETEDGVNTHCQIFEADKEGKTTTGTEFSFQVSRENNCEPIMTGSHDILDSDSGRVEGIIASRVKSCKKGLG